jgi:hypothetical protein
MLLVLGIVGGIYVIAMVVLGGLWREALRRSPSDSGARDSNIIPFERRSAPQPQADTGEN